LSKFLAKLKEVSFSVIPVTVLVLILHFTVIPMETTLVFGFLIGAALIILGLTFFLMGVDSSITPKIIILKNGIIYDFCHEYRLCGGNRLFP